jgi:hypothetical protein
MGIDERSLLVDERIQGERVQRFYRAEVHQPMHVRGPAGGDHIAGALDVCLKKLPVGGFADRNSGSRVEDDLHARENAAQGFSASDVAIGSFHRKPMEASRVAMDERAYGISLLYENPRKR